MFIVEQIVIYKNMVSFCGFVYLVLIDKNYLFIYMYVYVMQTHYTMAVRCVYNYINMSPSVALYDLYFVN